MEESGVSAWETEKPPRQEGSVNQECLVDLRIKVTCLESDMGFPGGASGKELTC